MTDLSQVALETKRKRARLLLQEQAASERGFLERAQDFLTGQSPQEEDLPAVGSIGEGLSTGQKLRIAAGMLATPDEKQRAQIIKETVPGVTVDQDRFGNFTVEFGKETPELKGRRFALNPAGLSTDDFLLVISEIAKFLPAARFGSRGGTTAMRAGRTAGAEGATQAVSDVGAAALGADVNRGAAATRAGVAAVSGAVGQVASDVLIPFLRQTLRSRRFVKGGQLTRAGRQAAREAGIDPDQVDTAFNEIFGQELARRTPVGSQPQANVAATTALSQRLGVPVTKGQRTQDITQLSNEEILRQTEPTRQAVRDFDVSQRESVGEAATEIRESFGGPGIRSRAQAGEIVKARTDEIAERLQTEITTAYEAAGQAGAEFTGPSLTALSKRAGELARDFPLDPKLTPAARSILRDLNNLGKRVRRAGKSERVRPVDLEMFDITRRRIRATINSIPRDNRADKAASVRLLKTYDEFINEAFVNELFQGDPGALDALLKARRARRLLTETFGQRDASDQAGKIIEKIREIDATPEQFINAVFGAGRLGGKDVSSKVVGRMGDIVGRGSVEFGAIKEAGFLQLIQDRTVGRQGKEIQRFLRDSPTLANELYTKQEQNLLSMYAEVVNRIAPEKGALNPSRSAFTLNAIQEGTSRTLRVAAQKQVFGGQALLGNAIGIFRSFLDRFSKQGQRVRAAEEMIKDITLSTSLLPAAVAPALGQLAIEETGLANGR